MRVLFTGATGVLGRETIPLLTSAGHDVIGVARSVEDEAWLRDLGARPQAIDLFDTKATARAVSGVDAVVHFATSIPPLDRMAKRQSWRMNDRLRSVATNNLVSAASTHRVSRFVQQSVTFFYADGGDGWLDETAPISPAWDVLDSALEAEAHVDRFTNEGGDGVVLRLARLYGPGAGSEEYIEALRSRRVPIVGDGANYVSSIRSEDAAAAVLAALTAPRGVYNVADDEPIRSAELTTEIAKAVGAPAPRRVPRWLARMVAGKAVGLLATSQRVSNRKLEEATGWAPVHTSAIEGWHQLARTL